MCQKRPIMCRNLRFSPATYNILTYYNRHQEIAGELESPRKARLISGISARQARIKRQKGLTLTTQRVRLRGKLSKFSSWQRVVAWLLLFFLLVLVGFRWDASAPRDRWQAGGLLLGVCLWALLACCCFLGWFWWVCGGMLRRLEKFPRPRSISAPKCVSPNQCVSDAAPCNHVDPLRHQPQIYTPL